MRGRGSAIRVDADRRACDRWRAAGSVLSLGAAAARRVAVLGQRASPGELVAAGPSATPAADRLRRAAARRGGTARPDRAGRDRVRRLPGARLGGASRRRGPAPGAADDPRRAVRRVLGPAFFDEAQVYAGAGYAVVMCNPRGSAGYGEAHAQAIKGAFGDRDAVDVLAFLDHALATVPGPGRRPGRASWAAPTAATSPPG